MKSALTLWANLEAARDDDSTGWTQKNVFQLSWCTLHVILGIFCLKIYQFHFLKMLSHYFKLNLPGE